MDIDIKLRFHPQGLRSYIEVDLCAQCPRLDDKGCCGYYSPVFYPTDFYYLQQHAPQVIDLIWSLPHLTVLDHSVTVNSFPDERGGYYCQFHSRNGGCRLRQEYRESICRHFVCPGIDWQSESSLTAWRDYFAALEAMEISLNQVITDHLASSQLSLRRPEQRSAWLKEVARVVPILQSQFKVVTPPDSRVTEVTIRRQLKYGQDWPL